MIEVNTYPAIRYFGPLEKHFGDLWKNLAFDIIFNELDMSYGPQENSRAYTRGHKNRHEIISAPPYIKFENGRQQNNKK